MVQLRSKRCPLEVMMQQIVLLKIPQEEFGGQSGIGLTKASKKRQ